MSDLIRLPRNADQQAQINRYRAIAWRGIIVALIALWSIAAYAAGCVWGWL